MYTVQIHFAHSLDQYGRISTEDLNCLCIILNELSTSEKMNAKSQNVCTVLYFDFYLCNAEKCN